MPITGYFFFTYFHIYHFSNYKGLQGPYFPINGIPGKLDTAFSVDKKRQKNFQRWAAFGRKAIQYANAQFGKTPFFETPCIFSFYELFILNMPLFPSPLQKSKPCL